MDTSYIWYRPPNHNTAAFVNTLNDILAIITRGNRQCYIMGDFNLDLLQYNDNVLIQEFVNRLFSFAFRPFETNAYCLSYSYAD